MNFQELWNTLSPIILGVCGYWIIRLDRRLESFATRIASEELRSATVQTEITTLAKAQNDAVTRREFESWAHQIDARLGEILDRLKSQ